MITVNYDGPLIPQEVIDALGPEPFREVAFNVADAARNHWIKLAEQDKSSFRFDYISGIQETVFQKDQAVITLLGVIPHMLEDGTPALDMRTTLLGNSVPVAPVGARGKHANKKGEHYRPIPFRHMTPGTKKMPRGKTSGLAIGAAYGSHSAVDDAKKLGAAVYRKARKLSATTMGQSTFFGTKAQWGERLDVSGIRAGLQKGQKGVPLLKPHHKTSIYASMYRIEKTYEKATQAHYMTFRTISESVPTGWIRAPIEARKYAQQVDSFVKKLLPEAMDAFFKG